MSVPTYTVKAGEKLVLPLSLTLAGMDWTNVVAECQVRDASGKLVHDFGEADGISTSDDGDTLQVLLTAEGSATRLPAWSGRLFGDLKVSRVSPAWGPFFPAEFVLVVEQPKTRT